MKPVTNPDYYRHTEWTHFYDADCEQYQVMDETKVIATGIESPADAKLLAAAPDLLHQRDALLTALIELKAWYNYGDFPWKKVCCSTQVDDAIKLCNQEVSA